MSRTVVIKNDCGETLSVELTPEGDTFLGAVRIDGVLYHVERVSAEKLRTCYCVDIDPDYFPKHDSHGECVLFAPYSQQ
jgi:hypothetical protein